MFLQVKLFGLYDKFTKFVQTNIVLTNIMDTKEAIITLLKASSCVYESLVQALKPHGISLQQFNVLRILRGQKGKAANLSTVQERMVNKMSNTTRLIDKLIDKNLVKRTICKENRRKIELFITKKGEEFLTVVDPIVDDAQEKIIQKLKPNEKSNLTELLNKLLK